MALAVKRHFNNQYACEGQSTHLQLSGRFGSLGFLSVVVVLELWGLVLFFFQMYYTWKMKMDKRQ